MGAASPQVYSKQIILFRTKVQSSVDREDMSIGWDRLANQKTKVNIIPGNHLTMLRKPHIQVLAAQLKACIVA